MSTIQTPLNGSSSDAGRSSFEQLELNALTHGKGRVPGQRAASVYSASGHPADVEPPTTQPAIFDLAAFSRALADRDLEYQLTHYAADADIRIVDPNNPPAAPLLIHGTPAIRDWLRKSDADDLGLTVFHVVDGGDRIAFTERWHYRDGTAVLATSTAELADGLITIQHTILAWGPS